MTNKDILNKLYSENTYGIYVRSMDNQLLFIHRRDLTIQEDDQGPYFTLSDGTSYYWKDYLTTWSFDKGESLC